MALNKVENTCLEERIRATKLLKHMNTMNTILTRTEIERAKLELSCVISGDLNPWKLDDSEEVSAFKITPVRRNAKVTLESRSVDDDTAAWGHSVGDQEGQTIPKMPCLAAVSLK